MTTPAISIGSKPQAIAALRVVWRQSAEHKIAQVERFVSAMVGVFLLQVGGDIAAHKNPFAALHTGRDLIYYLLPFVWVTWRQLHPAMTASQLDSAPGATIVPQQVGLPPVSVPAPAPTPVPAEPVEDTVTSPVVPGVDTTPTGDGPPVEGDAAP